MELVATRRLSILSPDGGICQDNTSAAAPEAQAAATVWKKEEKRLVLFKNVKILEPSDVWMFSTTKTLMYFDFQNKYLFSVWSDYGSTLTR